MNPGGLFKIKPERFGEVSSRRNEKVAELFRMIHLMEKAGTGIKRMRDGMIRHGLKEPIFDFDENFFIAKFEGYSKERLEGIAEGEEIIKLKGHD
ncbi:MAG: ATP-binding protein [bacterium]